VRGGDDAVVRQDAGAAELSPRRTGVLVPDTALPRERVRTCFHSADDAAGQRHWRRDGRPTAAWVVRHLTWPHIVTSTRHSLTHTSLSTSKHLLSHTSDHLFFYHLCSIDSALSPSVTASL